MITIELTLFIVSLATIPVVSSVTESQRFGLVSFSVLWFATACATTAYEAIAHSGEHFGTIMLGFFVCALIVTKVIDAATQSKMPGWFAYPVAWLLSLITIVVLTSHSDETITSKTADSVR